MNKQAITTVILKLGGSVITHKSREGMFIRRKVLARIARELKRAKEKNPYLRLILIHGAGAAGHQIAKRHGLISGVAGDSLKREGALKIRAENQKLNSAVMQMLVDAGLPVVTLHTGSCVIQENGTNPTMYYPVFDEALSQGYIPLMYGEMVHDKTQEMSICSGDVLAMLLAQHVGAHRIVYVSDIDGMFDRDPHRFSGAKHIAHTTLSNLCQDTNITLSDSHHIDVTGGLGNKIMPLCSGSYPETLEEMVLVNGLREGECFRTLVGGHHGTSIDTKKARC